MGIDKEDEEKEFLFNVSGSKTTDKKILDDNHKNEELKYPFVTTQASNNGVRDWYDTFTDEGNLL